jgi:hypothetical protein
MGTRRSLPIKERESSMRWVGGRWSEGMGRAAICRANDRADKRLGADAEQRHEANRWFLRP